MKKAIFLFGNSFFYFVFYKEIRLSEDLLFMRDLHLSGREVLKM